MDNNNDLSAPPKGDSEVNGSPLPVSTRTRIIELAHNGMALSDISRCLQVSNSCVLEILACYYETGLVEPCAIGGSEPGVPIADVVQKIAQYKRETPSLFAWEIRDCLLAENIYNPVNIPSVSLINRVSRNLSFKSTDTQTSTSGDSNSEYKYPTNHGHHQDLGDLTDTSNDGTSFTEEQTDALEQVFNSTHYPDIFTREKIAQEIHLPEAIIQIWFSKRRSKHRQLDKVKGHRQH